MTDNMRGNRRIFSATATWLASVVAPMAAAADATEPTSGEQQQFSTILYTVIIVAAVVLLLISLFFLWRYRRLAEKERRLRQQRERLLSIVSHEIRSPLVTLMTSLKMLRDCIDVNQKETIDIVNNIMSSIGNQLQMTSNLISWGQLQTGILKPNLINFDAMSVINETEKLVGESLKAKSMQIVRKIPARHIFVFADRQMILTILRNLLHNAIKFSNTDSEITIEVEREGDFFAFYVIDEGVGIKPEVAANLFKSPSKSTKGTYGEEGSGYGLSLCQTFVEKCGGTITLAPEHRIDEKGVAIKFTLVASKNQSL